MDPTPAVRLHTRPPHSTPAQRKALREKVRADCANHPGVYRMLGPTGAVLYVGQSRKLRTRLLSYFRAKGRRHKGARILRHAFDIQWDYTHTEFGAQLRELRLIKEYRPHFNSMMVADEWPRAYIALTGGAVPGLKVVPRSDEPNAIALFGPFRKVSFVRDAVRALADATGLRDCTLENAAASRIPTLWFADDAPLTRKSTTARRTRAPGCLRHELGTCTGPCVGAGERVAYLAQTEAVRAFLDGRSDAPVRALTHAMQHASDTLEFERAAVLRDRLAKVQWLHQRVQHFHANMDRLTFHYRTKGVDGSEWLYLIRRGTVRAELRAPMNDEEHTALEQLATRIFTGPDPKGADIPLHDLDEFYLVASWFRRHPSERTTTPPL